MRESELISNCRKLIDAYKSGKLGQTTMPEDTNPGFAESENEKRLAYFTLPMALNYQRDSYRLWEAALKTYHDKKTAWVFDVGNVANKNDDEVRKCLVKYKLALQPNKQTQNWKKISETVNKNFGSFVELFNKSDEDYLRLKEIIQVSLKKGFPYLSGPKIFNYWSFIMKEYGKINLKNTQFIEIAPDTHITKCSSILGIISDEEAKEITKEKISEKWRLALEGSGINPIDMHPPPWFWSRNGFLFKL